MYAEGRSLGGPSQLCLGSKLFFRVTLNGQAASVLDGRDREAVKKECLLTVSPGL